MAGKDADLGSGRGPGLTSPVLVARDRDLVRLVQGVLEGAALVVVEGEAGVGKTRLVREALADSALRGRRILIGRAHAVRGAFPLEPFVEALLGVGRLDPAALPPDAGALRPLLPELSPVLPPQPPALGDGRAEWRRLVGAVRSLLAAVGPAVCVLEDLHWAEEGTLEVLREILAGPLDAVTFVVTRRSGEGLPGLDGLLDRAAERIALEPLDAAHVARLVMAILGADAVTEEFSHYLHERTAGLPFAVEEVLRLLLDRGDLNRDEGVWTRKSLDLLAVPAAVRDSVAQRVGALDHPVRAVVEACAILDGTDDPAVLAAVAGLTPAALDGAVAEGRRTGMLAPPPGFALRHALAVEAVVGELGGPQRRRLHARAAAALEGSADRPAAGLAHHHKEAGDAVAAARWAAVAAAQAAALHDDLGACAILSDALALPGVPPGMRAQLGEQLGLAALHGLAHEQATAIIERILDGALLDPCAAARLRRALGLLLHQCGDAARGNREVLRALPDLRSDPALTCRALINLAAPWTPEHTLADHLAWLEEATAVAGAIDDPTLRLSVLVDRAAILMLVGDPLGLALARELPEVAELPAGAAAPRHLLRGMLNLAQCASWVGLESEALGFLARARDLTGLLHDARLADGIAAAAPLLAWRSGDWCSARAAVASAKAEPDVPHAAVDMGLTRAALDLAGGDPEAARSTLRALLAPALRSGSVPVHVSACGTLARLDLAAGDTAAAQGWVDAGLAVLRRKAIWVWWADLAAPAAGVLRAAGEDATELVDEAQSALTGRLAPAGAAALLHARALAARQRRAGERCAVQAARAYAALGRPHAAALAWEDAGLLSRSAAGDHFARAAEIFDGLGADWDAARVRRESRRKGEVLARPWRGGRRGYGRELSPRESQVVRLVAEGLTNREIADRLFLSPRTVEDHIASAVRKLGVAGRRDLGTPGSGTVKIP